MSASTDQVVPGHPIDDQSSATTVIAMRAVAAHPKPMSVGRAVKRPMTEKRVTTTIITAMIGTAIIPLSTALQISIWIGLIGAYPSPRPITVAAAMTP